MSAPASPNWPMRSITSCALPFSALGGRGAKRGEATRSVAGPVPAGPASRPQPRGFELRFQRPAIQIDRPVSSR